MRMIPDHTEILKEGEAYVCGEHIDGNYIFAMRYPVYFPGDLIKLRLLNRGQLLERLFESSENKYDAHKIFEFFDALKTGLVLSTNGNRSAADMMSGGDFDGDMAWVSWNKTLLDQVRKCTPMDHVSSKPSSVEESRLFFKSKPEDHLQYAYHYRYHQIHLGKLSNMLTISTDFYGFDHIVTREIGKLAYAQVK